MTYRILPFICLLAIALPSNVSAHHSHSTMDRDDIRLYSGVVTKYGWAMPHVFLKVKGPDADGNLVEYSIEMQSPPGMSRKGWDRDTWKPGDRITWEGAHDRDPQRNYTGLLWAERGDGTRVGSSLNGEDLPVPSSDFSGLWSRSDPGGMKPHYAPPEGWPFSAQGQELVDNFNEDQNPMVTCGNPGPPKSMIVPYPVKFSRPDEDTIIMERELMTELRTIYLDRNREPGDASKMGHSVGWFEGDTLVVETTNFIADKWGSHTGVDSSEQKHLREEFVLTNDGLNLVAEITITDPVYLIEPVTFHHYWRKLSDRDIIQAPCTMESATLYLEGGR